MASPPVARGGFCAIGRRSRKPPVDPPRRPCQAAAMDGGQVIDGLAVDARGLVRSFGAVRAVAGIDLEVAQGHDLRACSGRTAPARPR